MEPFGPPEPSGSRCPCRSHAPAGAISSTTAEATLGESAEPRAGRVETG